MAFRTPWRDSEQIKPKRQVRYQNRDAPRGRPPPLGLGAIHPMPISHPPGSGVRISPVPSKPANTSSPLPFPFVSSDTLRFSLATQQIQGAPSPSKSTIINGTEFDITPWCLMQVRDSTDKGRYALVKGGTWQGRTGLILGNILPPPQATGAQSQKQSEYHAKSRLSYHRVQAEIIWGLD